MELTCVYTENRANGKRDCRLFVANGNGKRKFVSLNNVYCLANVPI